MRAEDRQLVNHPSLPGRQRCTGLVRQQLYRLLHQLPHRLRQPSPRHLLQVLGQQPRTLLLLAEQINLRGEMLLTVQPKPRIRPLHMG